MAITVSICGCGQRGLMIYAPFATAHPDRMRIVAGADPDPERRGFLQSRYAVPAERCFASAEALLAEERLSDVLIVSTPDRQHAGIAIEALRKGYHVLLEKPIAPTLAECFAVRDEAHRSGNLVMVCHVLRYAPFYARIQRLIEQGGIGRPVSIDAVEGVGYWHQAHSYVRGNWRSSAESSPMILAKSCHDLDILRWLAGSRCRSVSSVGSLLHFRPQNAPPGSAAHCTECHARKDCPYDAEKIYITDRERGVRHGNVGWPVDVLDAAPTEASVRRALDGGRYGRCVYRCDNDVVDHQSVLLEFENEVTATFTMCGFTKDCHRTIRVMGTMGEIEGDLGRNRLAWKRFGQRTRILRLDDPEDGHAGHGGGDAGLMEDLCRVVEAHGRDALTSIDASVESHVMAHAAEHSRLRGGIHVPIDGFGEASP